MFIIFCATSHLKTNLKGRKTDEIRIKLKDGCEGTWMEVCKRYLYPPVELTVKDGVRLTSVQPIGLNLVVVLDIMQSKTASKGDFFPTGWDLKQSQTSDFNRTRQVKADTVLKIKVYS